MAKKAFSTAILEEKKKLFLKEVYKAARDLDVEEPIVKFWEKDCPYHKGRETAHYHQTSNTICISYMDLSRLSFEEIRETATHEVTHAVEEKHNFRFYKTQEEVKLSTFEPPTNLPHIGKVQRRKIAAKNDRFSRTKLGFCYFLECKEKDNLKECCYCHHQFCSNHLTAEEPRIRQVGSDDVLDRWADLTPNVHPCAEYVNYLEREREKRNERYKKALKHVATRKLDKDIDQSEEHVRPLINSRDFEEEEWPFEGNGVKDSVEQVEEDGSLPEEIDGELLWSKRDRTLQESSKVETSPKPRAKPISIGRRYDQNYEMYDPGKKKHQSSQYYSLGHFKFKNFLRRYVYFRIQEDVKPHLSQFGILLIIGLVLNYVYYQTLSLGYLFIGGVNEWFSVLNQTLNYGLGSGYSLFYLIINGIYYAFFYYSFVLIIYETITNFDDRDTWVMLGWFAVILWIVTHFFPQVI